jgi:hypothetical protein
MSAEPETGCAGQGTRRFKGPIVRSSGAHLFGWGRIRGRCQDHCEKLSCREPGVSRVVEAEFLWRFHATRSVLASGARVREIICR